MKNDPSTPRGSCAYLYGEMTEEEALSFVARLHRRCAPPRFRKLRCTRDVRSGGCLSRRELVS